MTSFFPFCKPLEKQLASSVSLDMCSHHCSWYFNIRDLPLSCYRCMLMCKITPIDVRNKEINALCYISYKTSIRNDQKKKNCNVKKNNKLDELIGFRSNRKCMLTCGAANSELCFRQWSHGTVSVLQTSVQAASSAATTGFKPETSFFF